MRARTAIALAVMAFALLAAAAALAGTTTKRDGPLTATFTAGSQHPNCKQLWPVKVTATFNGKPAHATAYYEWLFGGVVIHRENVFYGTKYNRHNTLYHFTGSFDDTTFGPWGSDSVGHWIEVEAVVQVGRYKATPWYNVEAVAAKGCPKE